MMSYLKNASALINFCKKPISMVKLIDEVQMLVNAMRVPKEIALPSTNLIVSLNKIC